MAHDQQDVWVWRPTFMLRLVAIAYTMFAFVLGLWMITLAADEGAVFQGVGFAAVVFWTPAILGLRYIRRARIEAHPQELVVVTTFSERRVPWRDVVGASPGYYGITLVLRDGTTFLAGAVQKSNVSRWLNRRTRADAITDLILARSSDARA